MALFLVGIATLALVAASCAGTPASAPETKEAKSPAGTETLVLGGGCFWCTEAVYEELNGVVSVESGYAGGDTKHATYEQVCSGVTGHAEVVKITYDPKVISAHDLLSIFFTVHDPTTLNRQGQDVGTQYRSVIFYSNDKEKDLAKSVIEEVTKAKIWPNPIVTTVEPLKNYSKAEAYHQGYYDKFESADGRDRQAMNAGYCTYIIEPKVAKFRKEYADRLKKPSSH